MRGDDVSREEIMEHADIRHVAVIGTGTIGASWAAYYLSRGLSVAASDPAPRAETRLRRFVVASWPALVRLGAAQPLPDKVPEDRLSFHAEPEPALASADFVQENAPEREEVKRALLARLDAALPPDLYDLQADKPPVLVDRRLQLEVPERLRHDGRIETVLDETAVRNAVRVLRDAGVKAVAVCFLYSFLDTTHEAVAHMSLSNRSAQR